MSPTIHESEPLGNFTTDPARFLEMLRQKGEPLLLTVEGQPGVVVQDAASYQRFQEALDKLESLAAVKEGLQDVAAGRTLPMREALEDMARKHNLPPVQGE
jgi:prevent-host-death family protein